MFWNEAAANENGEDLLIEITRSLARQLKTIFRRAITETGRGIVNQPVLLHAGPEGLRIRIASNEVAAEYHDPSPREPDVAYIPFGVLKDCEAKTDEPVQVEMATEDRLLATWDDHHVPQMKQYDIPPREDLFPDWPDAFTDNPPELVDALHAAMETASPESTRYSLHCIQLQGSGSIAATDASQMLLQTGFDFPWDEDLLIPRRLVFGSPGLPRGTKVQVGKSDGWVWFRMGHWSFAFAINADGRFPHVESMVRDQEHAAASIQIDPRDANFLVKSMKQLPGNETRHSPVTVDANGSVAVRSKSEDAPHPVEIVLSNSSRAGQEHCINTDRTFLRRALDLGFRELHIFAPDQPILCADDRRQYLWAVLTPEEAVKPSSDAVRISSAFDAASVSTKNTQPVQETTVPNTRDQAAGKADQQPVVAGSAEELIGQAEQLKTSLRDSLAKTNELVASLKRHRKEAKIVRTTLDSLRQLQTVS